MMTQIYRKIATLDIWRVGLITLAIVVSCIAGLSFLVYDEVTAPLFVGGAVVAVSIVVAWLYKPVWALYAAVFASLVPEGILPSTLDALFTRVTLAAAVGVWILYLITQRRRIIWTTTTLLMVGFVFWSTFTLFWAADSASGIEKTIQYILRLALFLVLLINEIDSQETLNGLMNTLAFDGWLLITVSIIVLLSKGYQIGSRLQIFNMNSNTITEHLIVAMPGVAWQVMRSSGQRRKLTMVLSICYILLSLILTALSGSRGGAIAIFATLLAFWIWKPTRPWGRLGMFILVILIISTPFVFSTVVQRFVQADEGALGGREPIWQAGWALISDHPLGGVGIGNSNRAIMPYLRLFTDINNRTERAMHNPVLQIWADTGIIGLALYLGVLISALWSFSRRLLQHKGKEDAQAAYLALVACMAVGSLLSWIKGGGAEHAASYFIMLALLALPSCLNMDKLTTTMSAYVTGP